LVFGITELGRMLMRTNVLTQAAREGARAAAVGADSTSAAARVLTVLTAAGLDDNNPVVEVVGPDADNMMHVTVFCDFQVIPGTLLPFSGTLVLRGASAMRLEG
jgi:Flp pilus assembly protein TadG